MRTTTLGPCGPVGRIGLGCMGMSAGYDPASRDDENSVRIIHRAIELGVNLIDTADVYGPFVNEELVGRAIRGHRDEIVLATKAGLVYAGDGPYDEVAPERNGRPEYIRQAIDASLRRLGIDHIDLWQLHRIDPAVPVEETWGAMAEAVIDGKVSALGLCEVSVEDLRRAQQVHPVVAVQSELSLWTREPLAEVLPYCAENGITFIAFCPLGRGFLTGRFRSAADLNAGDARRGLPRFQEEAIRANRTIVERIAEIGADYGATPGQVALAWLLARGPNVVPIPGTTADGHLKENVAADAIALDADALAALDALPQPTGSRY
ncbi:aldo/keto reductase [Actinoplanes sp. NPDC024001]|uniref:aldo/keto reductase n=1 Tax=Actinoplanes sp. NPDC024001 TaxID=3154598 RepID=UPI0033EC9562